MSNCPECNKTMGFPASFITGFCPSCAGKYITQQAKRITELEAKYEDTQQLRQKSAKMIIAIVRLNERIKEMQAQLDMEGIG